jgi:uncharacterized protein (DUF4415 family)
MATKLTRATTAELRRMGSQTDLARVEVDEREGKVVVLDADDTPLTAGELASAKRRRGERGKQKAPTKEAINLRVDRFVVESFRSLGPGWQTMMNTVLRQHVEARSGSRTGFHNTKVPTHVTRRASDSSKKSITRARKASKR